MRYLLLAALALAACSNTRTIHETGNDRCVVRVENHMFGVRLLTDEAIINCNEEP